MAKLRYAPHEGASFYMPNKTPGDVIEVPDEVVGIYLGMGCFVLVEQRTEAAIEENSSIANNSQVSSQEVATGLDLEGSSPSWS